MSLPDNNRRKAGMARIIADVISRLSKQEREARGA